VRAKCGDHGNNESSERRKSCILQESSDSMSVVDERRPGLIEHLNYVATSLYSTYVFIATLRVALYEYLTASASQLEAWTLATVPTTPEKAGFLPVERLVASPRVRSNSTQSIRTEIYTYLHFEMAASKGT
jgi:hypothetical protein